MDAREHRFQLGVVGALVLALTSIRRPKLVIALALVTAFPVLPQLFRRLLAARLSSPTVVEDDRLPAFARVAGGAGLAFAAFVAAVAPSRITYAALSATGVVCLYGAATGYCVPCHALSKLEQAGLVELDPPLICAVRS